MLINPHIKELQKLNLVLFRRLKHWRTLLSTNSNPWYLLFPSQTTPWSILTKQQSGVKLGRHLTYSELFLMLLQLVLMPGLLTRLARMAMMLEWHRLVLVWPQVSSTAKLHSNSVNLIGSLIGCYITMIPRGQVFYEWVIIEAGPRKQGQVV